MQGLKLSISHLAEILPIVLITWIYFLNFHTLSSKHQRESLWSALYFANFLKVSCSCMDCFIMLVSCSLVWYSCSSVCAVNGHSHYLVQLKEQKLLFSVGGNGNTIHHGLSGLLYCMTLVWNVLSLATASSHIFPEQ